jgi:hypothetical protein
MLVLGPDFYSSIHRTLIDIASLLLLVIGLVRIALHDLKSLMRACQRNRNESTRQHRGTNQILGAKCRRFEKNKSNVSHNP